MYANSFQPGDKVFVIYRNPHAANVAQIQEAEIVRHPLNQEEMSLFLHETYHALADDDAVFASYDEAEKLYNELFYSDDYDQYS